MAVHLSLRSGLDCKYLCARKSLMEWYGAFGLMPTLIWLYLEILILLSKLYSRR